MAGIKSDRLLRNVNTKEDSPMKTQLITHKLKEAHATLDKDMDAANRYQGAGNDESARMALLISRDDRLTKPN